MEEVAGRFSGSADGAPAPLKGTIRRDPCAI